MSDTRPEKPSTSSGHRETSPGRNEDEVGKGKETVEKELKKDLKEKKKEFEEVDEDDSDPEMDAITRFFSQKLNLVNNFIRCNENVEKIIDDLSFEGLCERWRSKGFQNIITMVGAGISTSAGIPDFRSPGTGLYDNLQKYKLPRPTAIFELDYFAKNPKPFFTLAKELYPGSFNPTPAHYFIRLLHEKGILLRHYTQNIDTLDRIAGIPDHKLVEAHGTFYTNHCTNCRQEYGMEWMKEQIFADTIPYCRRCRSLVKPDIVFFGENLPERFYSLPSKDFEKCDLLIIMGTSLEVQPFASLLDYARSSCLRLLINRTRVSGSKHWFLSGPNFMAGHVNNTRDLEYIGDCDDGVFALAEALGWTEELNSLMTRERKRLSTDTSVLNSKEK